ncbi:MAG: 3-dehydroquinate dehydratase [Steroidobacteraceae bacterium]|nr:3-dehydroquinate dehydratase [Steroidobacteraceae bacterium]
MAMSKRILVRGKAFGDDEGPLVCIPLVGRTADAIRAELESVISAGADLIEWRADFFSEIGDSRAVLGLARELATTASGVPLIFTIRSAAEGGQPIPLTVEQVSRLCADVCSTGSMGLVDTEMSTEPHCIDIVRTAARGSETLLILSFHDFTSTPDTDALFRKFVRAQELGGDVAKVAVMPQTPADVLALLDATLRAHTELDLPLISMSMGPLGVLTRAAGWMFGSSVTFAAGVGRSAPGQLPVADLNKIVGILREALQQVGQ